jgi:hypothetical protein
MNNAQNANAVGLILVAPEGQSTFQVRVSLFVLLTI